jgi:hypothetical protein
MSSEDSYQAPPVPTLQGATRALFVLSEANKMLKRATKPGDDSLETILQLCTADGVGTNNAGEDTDRDLNGDWYNCTILLGGQAHVVGEVAKDDTSGLRERSEWALAADPDIPDRGDTTLILEDLLALDTDDMIEIPADELPGMDPDDVNRGRILSGTRPFSDTSWWCPTPRCGCSSRSCAPPNRP